MVRYSWQADDEPIGRGADLDILGIYLDLRTKRRLAAPSAAPYVSLVAGSNRANEGGSTMPRARKSGSSRTSAAAGAAESPRRSAADSAVSDRLVEAALNLAERKGWRGLGMGEIAREAKVPLATAYAQHRTKPSLLIALTRQTDAKVLAGGEAEGSPREKLFELLMRRFDALKPHRKALRAVIRDSIADPAAYCGAPVFLNSMTWMLEAAGISAADWRGPGRVLALAGLYAMTFRAFLDDDSADLSKTMAALDRRLKSGPFNRSENQPQAA
jgi:AcrR family transcriptional regulator